VSAIRYTDDHEWLRDDGDGTFTVGITRYARERIGEILFVEPPLVGARIEQGQEACVIESAKSVIELRMPLSGVISAVNASLAADRDSLNRDPMGAGWLMKVRLDSPAEADDLLDETAYARLLAEQRPENEP
jgi:glycine cleavage system H protein